MVEDLLRSKIMVDLNGANDDDLKELADILEETEYPIWCGGHIYEGLLTTVRRYRYLYVAKETIHASKITETGIGNIVSFQEFIDKNTKIMEITSNEIDHLFGEA